MPLLSAFTPFGMLAFSSSPSEGEKVYRSMRASYQDPRDGSQTVDMSPGTWQEAKLYATAMMIAAANVTLQRAGKNLRGETAYEMLTAHEDKFSIAPGPNDTAAQRQAILAARQKLARGPRREAITEALRAILGDSFLAYRPITTSEASVWPSSPGSGPGVWTLPTVPARVIRITDPITASSSGFSGSAFAKTVGYENWLPNEPDILLRVGDALAIQPENLGLAEKVTVTAVSETGASRTFTATFANGHDQNCSATTGPMPLWTSTKRFVLIVVKSTAALDKESVRRVDELMERASRGPTLWAIVQPTTPGASTIGPFTLGSSPLGAVTVAQVTF